MTDKSIVKYYEIHDINGLTFRFKLDKNDITCEYEPHIWHRHQVEPDEVVAAFFNIEQSIWNFKYNRFEAYSKTDDLYIYYNYYSKDRSKIMIITAFTI